MRFVRGFSSLCRRSVRALPVALVACALLCGTGGRAAVAQGATPAPSFADLVTTVGPAVVNVSTQRATGAGSSEVPMPSLPPGSPFEDFFKEFMERDRDRQPEQQQRNHSLGSGFIVDPRGFVVTNNHVINEADEITVTLSDDRELPATLVGRDAKTDLAVLKIEGPEPFPFVAWADSNSVRVGDWMVAIGNPFGLGSTVTAGIVSALNRDIRAGPYNTFIQVDAAINRGNSGGPSFDLAGNVFGVNTAIFSPSGANVGIGFAIPANLARPVIDSLIRSGRVARGWLGVRIQSVSAEIGQSMNLPESRGALVAGITPGGPAERAAIRTGDVILDFDGKPIDRMRSLPRLVAETPIGKEVELRIWRDGTERKVRVVLGELPEDEALAEAGQPPAQQPGPTAQARVDALGLTVAPISPELKTRFSLAEAAKGVVITEVKQGSPAAEESLQAGDLVVEVGQQEVSSAPEMTAKIANAQQDGKKSVLLLVDRKGDLRFVALKLAQ